MANEKHRRRSFFALWILLVVLTACESPVPLADRLLLPRLAPVFEGEPPAAITVVSGGEADVDPQRRHLLQVLNSRREAVLTFGGLSWRTKVPTRNRPVLQAMLAAVGAGESSGEVAVEAGGREIYRAAVDPGPWQLHELELEELGDVELVLRSDGDAPIAWADVVLTWPAADRRPDRRPNIVLVSIDTLRADHLSCYGYERPTSPHLDRLAAESVLFTRSFSASTWTLPSTATLLTGLLPAQHNVRRPRDSLTGDFPTLAGLLSDAGYRTVGFADGGYLGFGFGLAHGFQSYTSGAAGKARTDDVAAVVERASSWLRGNRFEPFFLFLQTYETHQPYRNREGFADPFLDQQDGLEITSARPFKLLASEPDNPAVWRRVEALYDGEIARADHYLGRFFDTLRDRRIFERTSILATSDHGEEFLERGGVDHAAGKVFDENVGVPLILRLPGNAGGEVATTPVTGADVVPTLLELAGLAPSPELVGRSLLNLRGNADGRPVFVHGLSALHGQHYRLDVGSQSLILKRREGVVELYDRGVDPGMRRPKPAAGSPLAERLQSLLAWMSKWGPAFSRLPAGAELLRIPPDSAIVPVSVWQGLEWRWISRTERDIVLDGRAAALVFEIEEEGELTVKLRSPEGDLRSLVLRSQRPAAGWSPIVGPPEIGQALATARTRDSAAAVIDDLTRRELRALGYL